MSPNSSAPDCSRASATVALVFLVVLALTTVVPLLATTIGPIVARTVSVLP